MSITTTGLAAAIGALALTPLAAAQTLEFEDLTDGTQYFTYGSFSTDGVTVNVNEYDGFSGGGVSVVNPNTAGAGNGLSMGNVMLDFQLAFPLTAISFAWADFGGTVGLSVNGVELYESDMIDYDGTTQGGANISVSSTPIRGGLPSGVTTITGNITQFAVGGQEFELDDVRGVPTPGAASVLALAGLAATRRRR